MSLSHGYFDVSGTEIALEANLLYIKMIHYYFYHSYLKLFIQKISSFNCLSLIFKHASICIFIIAARLFRYYFIGYCSLLNRNKNIHTINTGSIHIFVFITCQHRRISFLSNTICFHMCE